MRGSYKKKAIGIVCTALLAASLAAGCSKDETKKIKVTEVKENELVEGGTVRVAIQEAPDSLDPYISSNPETEAVLDNVYDGLLESDENGELQPAIAQSYTVSDDGLVYTVQLREGVTFHDGSEVTAEDVQYSYSKLLNLDGSEEVLTPRFPIVESMEAEDEDTVIFNLKEKDASFPAKLTAAIVPNEYTEAGEKPIGAGPFRFVSYLPGQKLVLEKNEGFYNAEKVAHIERAEFIIVDDPVAALEAGEVDLLPSISADDAVKLGDAYSYMKGPQNMVQLLALNHEQPPFNKLAVRQALNYAVDKDAIIEEAVGGNGTKLGSHMSPVIKYYEQDLEAAYKHDVKQAKQLLAEAGLSDGFEMTITVPSSYKLHVDTAYIIAEQLKKVNIQVQVNVVEWSEWMATVYGKKDYDATVIGFAGKLDPHDILIPYESKNNSNFQQYDNIRFDLLMSRARAEMDPVKRTELYKEAEAMLTEDAAAVYIMDPDYIAAMSKKVAGFQQYPVPRYNMTDVRVAE